LLLFLKLVSGDEEFWRLLRKVLASREQGKRVFAVAKKGSWSPRTGEKSVCCRQERFLEPENRGKERLLSPRKVLGAREQGKRAFAVAKKDSWSPRTGEKSVCGRQERFLEPENRGKERLRSPRKILGAHEQGKRAFAVAKKDSWSP
jgi:hypothetical protein